MIERDYIMRMIAELGAVLSRLILHRRRREFPEALSTVDKACKQLLGADTAILDAFSDDQLIRFYGRDPNTAPARWYAVGTLLAEKAEIFRDMDRVGEALELEEKSLSLMLESLRLEEEEVQPDHVGRIDRALERLAGVPQTVSVTAKVDWYRAWRETRAAGEGPG